MSNESKDRLAGAAIFALTVISLTAIIGGIYAATVNGREIEGIVAIVAGAVGGIVGIIVQNKVGGTP